MIDKDTKIFDDISFSDMAKEIFNKKKEKDKQISALINDLKPLVKNVSDAAMLVPLLKEYMDISVKNDEVLVKLIAIVQKLITNDVKVEAGEYGLSKEEKAQLLGEAKALKGKLIDVDPNTYLK